MAGQSRPPADAESFRRIEATAAQFANKKWRLNNLYWIVDKDGKRVPFRMNPVQEQVFDGTHNLNLILKSRRHGMTTLIQLDMLDDALFNSDMRCGTIAHTVEKAEDIFRDKVKFPYDHLPEGLKAKRPAKQDSVRTMMFSNNSSIAVDTSFRSSTLQRLHISEYGKICAQYPEKAREIRTGALEAVHVGQIVWIESTAEGQDGDFFRRCQDAKKMAEMGKPLTALDWKFFFFGWFQDAGNRLTPADAANVVITDEHEAYFTAVMAETGCALDRGQKSWYAKKLHDLTDDMKREHPSTPKEAFEAAIEGAYYATQMTRVREQGRIGFVPWEPSLAVNTFWDLGMNDMMTIWFHQRYRHENRFIDFYRNHGHGFDHYARVLQERGYVYGKHYLPHDAEVRELSTTGGKSRKEVAEALGIRPIVVVPRIERIEDGREAVRQVLGSCWFDEKKCADGILDLDNYRHDWDEKLGRWADRHHKDIHVHGADSFRQFAQGYSPDDEVMGNLGAASTDQPHDSMDDMPASFDAV
jgi:hypothetical protein